MKKKGKGESQNLKVSQERENKGSQDVKEVKKNGKHGSQEDDGDGTTSCLHLKKAVTSTSPYKFAKSAVNSDCQDCKPPKSGVKYEMPVVWMCLQCGHRGCGRNSEEQHAVKHHEKPMTGLHCLVVSMDDWSVWCYKCDKEVPSSGTGHIAQLVSVIKNKLEEVEEEAKSEAMSTKRLGNLMVVEKKQASKAKTNVTAKDSSEFSVKGLSNLGNTCFFNSVIQNLCQTRMLRQLLSKVMAKIKVNVTPGTSSGLEPIVFELDQPGSLTQSMGQLLNQVQTTKERVIHPRCLFTQVCKKAARFQGYKQQDSQELLRYLLDGMRAEEAKRLRAGILEALKTSGNEESVKEYVKSGSPKNFVDEVFGGEITSTVMCGKCNTVSSVTETFLDLSLPVSDDSTSSGHYYIPSPSSQKKRKKNTKHQKDLTERQKQKEVGEHTDNGTQEEMSQGQLAEMSVSQQVKEDCDPAQANSECLEEDSCASALSTTNGNRFNISKDETISETDQEAMGEVADEMVMMSLDEAFVVGPEVMEGEMERDFLAQPKEYTVVNQDAEMAFHTLATRTTPGKQECSVESCLFQFTKVENLTQANRLLCATCTAKRRHESSSDNNKVYTDAVKQILISSPPPVLTLHLKRFQQIGQRLCKVNRHVRFPHKLDLAPFCAAKCKTVTPGDDKVLYSLYGIVEHSGSMRSGHYTATVKALSQLPAPSSNGAPELGGEAPPRHSWFHISDSSVHPIPESKVEGSQAYLLFYERVLQPSGSQDVSL